MFTRITLISKGNAFGGCTKLANVNFNNITRIEGQASLYPLANTKLTTIELPNITSLGDYGFTSQTNGKTSIKTVILGSGLATLQQYSFRSLTNVKILINATTPQTLSSGSTLNRHNNSGTYIYVPDDSYDDYYNSSVFSSWESYLRKMSTYTE